GSQDVCRVIQLPQTANASAEGALHTSLGRSPRSLAQRNQRAEGPTHNGCHNPDPTPPAIPSPQTATCPPRSSSPPTPAACASPSKRSAHRRTPPAAAAPTPRSPPQPALLAESKSQHPQPPAPPRQNMQSPPPPESKPASSSRAAHPAHCAGKRSVNPVEHHRRPDDEPS